ncbi:MAG TPA: alkaline shock response membrane anchor protein AmaP [Desulfobacteria bacterium]|nr:alkaline shock response membrane anchor protein AmaP [Desulfobacteria bacterium]
MRRELNLLGFLDRLLMVIYTLGIMAALFVAGLAALGWRAPVDLLQVSLLHDRGRAIIAGLIVFFLFLSLKFFLQALSRAAIPERALVKETEMGQISVSLDALENMCFRVANQVKGVKDVKPKVAWYPEGIKVLLKIVLTPDVSVPEVTDEIQSMVKRHISENVGINVAVVKILVEDISSEISKGMPRKLN